MEEKKPQYEISNSLLCIIDAQRAFGEVIEVPGVNEALANMVRLIEWWQKLRKKAGDFWFWPIVSSSHTYFHPSEVGREADFFGADNLFGLLNKRSKMWQLHPVLHDLLQKEKYYAKDHYGLLTNNNQWSMPKRWSLGGIPATVVLAGLTTPICVQDSAVDLMAHGAQVVVVGDACASQAIPPYTAEESHRFALARLAYSVAEVLTTDEVIARAQSEMEQAKNQSDQAVD